MDNFIRAEAGIRQLMGRYADAVWRQDSQAFAECWTEDAVWKIAGRIATGRPEIAALFQASVAPSERVMLWAGIPVLEVGEGTATGRVQITELIKRKSGEAFRTLALYYDHYREEAGRWRYSRRHFNMYYMGAPDLSDGIFPGVLEYGPPPGMPGPDDPTPVKPG